MARYPNTTHQTDIPTVRKAPEEPAQRNIVGIVSDSESTLIRMASQSDSFNWDKAIQAIETLDDYSILNDPFSLPPECHVRQEQKQYRYRWLDPKDQDRFVMQTQGRFPWVLATRNNAPYIPDHLRDENGLVRRAGMVLALMRYDVYMARQLRIWKLSEVSEKKGPAKAEGLEFTGQEGGKIKSGDIITAQEIGDKQFEMVNQVFAGGSD